MACCKTLCLLITVNYRESYGLFACNGILFNHESPIRGETCCDPKNHACRGTNRPRPREPAFLGNLNAMRDWGHARDYVRAQWLALQQDVPDDYVICHGGAAFHQAIVSEGVRGSGHPTGLAWNRHFRTRGGCVRPALTAPGTILPLLQAGLNTGWGLPLSW